MGHSDFKTTQVYLQTDRDMLIDLINNKKKLVDKGQAFAWLLIDCLKKDCFGGPLFSYIVFSDINIKVILKLRYILYFSYNFITHLSLLYIDS